MNSFKRYQSKVIVIKMIKPKNKNNVLYPIFRADEKVTVEWGEKVQQHKAIIIKSSSKGCRIRLSKTIRCTQWTSVKGQNNLKSNIKLESPWEEC